MNKKIFNFFEIAGRTAASKKDRRAYLVGAIGIRHDGAMVRSLNAPTELRNRRAHAECKLCRKLDYYAEVYVARVKLLDGKFGMSRPCNSCRKILTTKKVRKVFYTIDENYYGILDLTNNNERVCSFKSEKSL